MSSKKLQFSEKSFRNFSEICIFSVYRPKKCKFALDGWRKTCYTRSVPQKYATVAQQVEQLTRNEQVVRSNRISSSKKNLRMDSGGFSFVVFSPLTIHRFLEWAPTDGRFCRCLFSFAVIFIVIKQSKNVQNTTRIMHLQSYSLFYVYVLFAILMYERRGSEMADFNRLSNDEKYQRIGLNIAYQRKLKKLTQLQLAELIGISRTHMSNIEAPNMVTPISLEVVFKVADALEVPVEILFKFT